MAEINVGNLSPELAKLVVKDGQVDTQKLQEIANSKIMNPELVKEANRLIAQELTGNKAWGDIGDKFLSTLNTGDNLPKTEEQLKKDFVERREKQERRAKRSKTAVGRWINNRQDDYASVKEKDGFGAKALEAGKVTLKGIRQGFKAMDELRDEFPIEPISLSLKNIRAGLKQFKEWGDAKFNDNDDEYLAMAERIWYALRSGADIMEYLVSTEGILATVALIDVGAIVAEALPAEAMARLAPFLNAATTTAGTGITVKGVVDVAQADTPEEAQKGGSEIFSGVMMVGMSAATSKQSLDAARHAGVTAKDPTTLNTVQAMAENFRVAPQGVKVAFGLQAPTWGAAIPASAIHMVSKPNEAQAYRFNPNGTTEEILANNPGVEKMNNGFGVVDKWKTQDFANAIQSGMTQDEAIASLNIDKSTFYNGKVYHTIDMSKEQMIMMYGGDDMAVCKGDIFHKTYVDTKAFDKGNGVLNYMDPAKQQYGKVIDVTKQGVGGVEVLPEGTVVPTLEGPKPVGRGDIVCYDVDGNPYVSPIENVFKRNVFSPEDKELLINQYFEKQGLRLEKFGPSVNKTSGGFRVISDGKTVASFELHEPLANPKSNTEIFNFYRSVEQSNPTAKPIDILKLMQRTGNDIFF